MSCRAFFFGGGTGGGPQAEFCGQLFQLVVLNSS